ncbi:unnamed protein product [Parnassius mnemosyne]|uniref:HTH CENPB-type domain-containing protein n=1 Tax=Parnassius mnemosyne TaxID=213953 RepID=A0AAV1KBM1_9NEOP
MAPPKKKINNNKKNAPYTQDTINKALRDIREKKKSIREVCRNYGIPRTTVQDRISGRSSDSIKTRGPDPILTSEVEKKIVDWLIDIAKCGFPIKKFELLDTVQKIIKDSGMQTPFKNDRPGQTWFINFMKRHPEISQRSAEGINKARARITEESIRRWFGELESFLVETNNRDILESPERIFNGDESGFALCPKTGKVLGPRGYRNLYQIKSGSEKDNLTVLVTFNAKAQVCPPLIVFPYIRPPKQIADSMPPHWVLGRSDSGWMRSDVFFEYITNDFNNWVVSNEIQRPILLLVDGHKSHMSLELSGMCEQMGIILYALPPNTTHILQPADVSVFGPLKSEWKNVVRKFLTKPENLNSSVTKTNFCVIFKDCLESTNMPRNIINGFRKCGLYPFDPNAVDYSKCVQNTLEKLNSDNSKTPQRNISKEITNADLVSARKVLKHLKLTLAEKNIKVAIILKEMRKLKRKSSQIQIDDVLYETCSEDRTNSTVNITTSQIIEEENNNMTSHVDDFNTTKMDSFETIPHSQTNENLLPQLSNIRPLNPFKSPESLCNTDQDQRTLTHDVQVTKDSSTDASESLIDDNISSLHLSGSYLEIGSLVSLEDILVIPTQISQPTTSILKIPEMIIDSSNTTTTQSSTIITMIPPPETHIITNKTSKTLENVLVNIPIKETLQTSETSTSTLLHTEYRNAIEKHLVKPEPVKKSIYRIRTPSSAAISSAEWRKFYEDKEKVKIEKLELSKKRQDILKKKRIEKEKLKSAKVQTRKIAKSKNSIKKKERARVDCALCHDILISDTEEDSEKNIGCDFCTTWYHLRCTDFVGLKYEEVQNKPFKCNTCMFNRD